MNFDPEVYYNTQPKEIADDEPEYDEYEQCKILQSQEF